MPVHDRGKSLRTQGHCSVGCITTTRGQQRHEKFTGSSKMSCYAYLLKWFPETLNSISSIRFLLLGGSGAHL